MRILSINEFKTMQLIEAAVSIDSIIDTNTILIRSTSKNETKLCLFDFVTQDIYGYITAFKASNDIWQIDRTSAEKGYGPLIYDLLLQELNPACLKPANKIKQEALNVWKYYFSKRSDVIKTPIPSNNPAYNDYYVENDNDDAEQLTDQDNLSIINTTYKMNRSDEYVQYLKESEHIIKEYGINKNNVFKNALSYFQQKYYGVNASYVTESLEVPKECYLLNIGLEWCLTSKTEVLAYANLIKQGKYYIFDKIYGPGYGKLMHELILMSIYPIPVRPSRSSKQAVVNIWKQLKDQSDVIKLNDIWPDYDDGILSKQTKDIDLFNNGYKLKPDQNFKNLIESSKRFEKIMKGVLPTYTEKRLKLGRSLYADAYIEK